MGEGVNWIAFAALMLTGITTLGGVGFGLVKHIASVKDDLLRQIDALRTSNDRRSEKIRLGAFEHTERLEGDLRKSIEYNKNDVQREHNETRTQISHVRKELESKINRLDDRVHEHLTTVHVCNSHSDTTSRADT